VFFKKKTGFQYAKLSIFLLNTGYLDGSRRLLDIGCATGDFVAWAKNSGWQAEGIDISKAAVVAGKKNGVPIREGSVEGLVEHNEVYDVITLWGAGASS